MSSHLSSHCAAAPRGRGEIGVHGEFDALSRMQRLLRRRLLQGAWNAAGLFALVPLLPPAAAKCVSGGGATGSGATGSGISDRATTLRSGSGRVLRVSPGQPAQSLAQTAQAARDGDTIEIEPGNYIGDVASWPQNDLTLKGVGARPRLIANGRSAEGKAIFVVKGKRVRIENLEFVGARVSDRNGAGIRIEDGPISISNCRFLDNENGILAGNSDSVEIDIDDSIFADNGSGDGFTHNLYVGTVARLRVTGCWFTRARGGHLLKSRARESFIQYCRLTDENERTSYELEFPSGGKAVAIGNVIQQGPNSDNATIVSFGAEGYKWRENKLTMAFNTIINDRPRGGIFVRVAAGAGEADLFDNLLVGPGTMEIHAPLQQRGNRAAEQKDFAAAAAFDYRLRKSSQLVGQAGTWGTADRSHPMPQREYEHEAASCPLQQASTLTPLSPGAFQRLAP